jgi:tape measure domain-containing protein
MALNTRVILSAQDRGVGRAFTNLGNKSSKAQRKVFGVNSALKQTNGSLTGLSSTMRIALGTLGIGGLVAGFAALTKQSLAVKIDFDRINNTLKAVTGSSEGAAAEMGFLTSEAKRLGIELRPLGQTYSRLLASTKALGFSSQDTQEIFSSFSEALTSFGASGQQSIRVFSALEQISSKGNVSMEEIRQQLGEALPGALSLAAKAMNVTEAEFQKLVAQGKIASKDFLIPFARVVREDLGKGAVGGAKLLNAQINRLTNAGERLFKEFGDGVEGGLTESIQAFTGAFGDGDAIKGARALGEEVGSFLREGTKLVITFSNSLKGLVPILASIAKGFAAIAVFKGLKGLIGAVGGIGGKLGRRLAGAPKARGIITDQSTSRQRQLGGRSREFRALDSLAANRAGGNQTAGLGRLQSSITNRTSVDNLLIGQRSRELGGRKGRLDSSFDSLIPPSVKKGARSFGRGLTKAANGLVNFLGPLNLLVGGIIAATVAFNHYSESKRIETKAIKSGQVADAKGNLFRAQLKATKSGLGGEEITEAVRAQLALDKKGLDPSQIAEVNATFKKIVARLEVQFPSVKSQLDAFHKKVAEAEGAAGTLIEDFKGARAFSADLQKVGENLKSSTGLQKLGPGLLKLAGDLLKKGFNANQVAKKLVPLAREDQGKVVKKRGKDQAEAIEKRRKAVKASVDEFLKETAIQKLNNKTLKKYGEEVGKKVVRFNELYRELRGKGLNRESAKQLATDRVKAENASTTGAQLSERLAAVQTITSQQGAKAIFDQRGINAKKKSKPKEEKTKEKAIIDTAAFAETTSVLLENINEQVNNLFFRMA